MANGHSPVQTLEEQLTSQFYNWEISGRGWQLWNEVVELEPPFRPFRGHYIIARSGRVSDDARKPTFLSAITENIKAFVGGDRRRSATAELEEPEEDAPEPLSFDDRGLLREVHIALPPQTKITKDAAEQFLMSLGHLCRPISFEIIGTADSIIVQIACGEADYRQVRAQLHAFFPEAVCTENDEYLKNLWITVPIQNTLVVDFGLSHEFMRPLRCFERFEPDPLAGIVGALTELHEGEAAVLQVLFSPAKHPWPESILRAVTDGQGGSFFADDPGLVSLAGRKIARPLFATVLRVAALSPDRNRAWRVAEGIGSSLRQFSDSPGNELIPLSNDGYDDRDHAYDLLCRTSRRSGALLNTDELVSLIHLPSASVRSEKLKREETKSKASPAVARGHRLVLGENCHTGKTVSVTLSTEQRLRHTYVVGASGTGKSTFLLNLVVQDIQNGEGLAVLDPHGDLIDQVMEHLPEERLADVILLDPSDEEYPIGFNVLTAHSELERNLLASDLVSVFRRLSTSWGDQMNTVLANGILAFLESSEGGTLSDLRRFLVEADFRARFLHTVRDPDIVYYWQKEFPLLRGTPQGPILTRLDTFLRPKLIRRMVAQKENRLDFGAIMNGRKIFLAKLSQGLIGEENSYLLGALLVSKMNQTAMSRQSIQAVERKPFYLYLDEFHNFVTPSLAAILAGARKYGLGLILAHQELRQLLSRDGDVASAVISNPHTRVCFRLGDSDAKKLEEGFSYFDARDLQNLGVGEAVVRIERSDYDFNLKTHPLPAVDPNLAARRRQEIISSSRARYATPREKMELHLAPASTLPAAPEVSPDRKPAAKPQVPLPPPQIPIQSVQPDISPQAQELPIRAGRGGPQHKYLQQLIKRWAESHGYRVLVEKQILDGMGSVDVALEKGDCSIACEISISTTAEHELGNIQKCLAAGFTDVAVLATEKRTLAKIAAIAQNLAPSELKRIHFFLPEELFSFLEARDAETVPKNATVRGYKVKLKLTPVAEGELKAKKQVIAQTIVHAMRRLKDKD